MCMGTREEPTWASVGCKKGEVQDELDGSQGPGEETELGVVEAPRLTVLWDGGS